MDLLLVQFVPALAVAIIAARILYIALTHGDWYPIKGNYIFEDVLDQHPLADSTSEPPPDFANSPPELDSLQSTILALKRTTLAGRADKLGAYTLGILWKLSNPFVSGSLDVQKAYRSSLSNLYRQTNTEGWQQVARAVADAVRPLIHQDVKEDPGSRGNIVCNIKAASSHATLAAVLQHLFEIRGVPEARLEYIASEIHRLTIAKKHFDALGCREVPADMQRDADHLIKHLRELFSNNTCESPLTKHILYSVSGTPTDFNPLDLLIPAFEAPWRAVYYTLLAVLQTGGKDQSLLRELMDTSSDRDISPQASAIVYESLRLYPPIRRVRRDDRVNIESVQRDVAYWGPDTLTFRPSRFLTSDGIIDQKLIGPCSAWMPFAVGRMKCPTAGAYSTRLVALITGEILRCWFQGATSLGWELKGAEWDVAAKAGVILRAGREEYSGVDIVVPNPQSSGKLSSISG